MLDPILQKKLDLLIRYEGEYEKGTPSISDSAYDSLRDAVIPELPPDHPYLDKIGHPTSSSWPKKQHIIFMGSQNKVSNVEEIEAWVNSIYKKLVVKDGDIEFVVQYKMDGFSLESVYEDKSLAMAITRGGGDVGEDIKQNASLMRHLPRRIPIDNQVVVRGEGVISKDDFESIKGMVDKPYKNPRNAASGISRRFDGRFCKYIRYYAYDINAKVETEQKKIEVLKKLGFNAVHSVLVTTLKDIILNYVKCRDTDRAALNYCIDGLVLKINDLTLQERLGVSHNKPNGQIALKFDSDSALTRIIKITGQVGRTGKVTPVASLEPVDLMGSTIRKATLHNYDYIEQNFIGEGAEVTIEKKGDIIPQVTEVVVPGEDYVKPTQCPSCGGPLTDDGVNLWCYNAGCPDREISRITYWMKALDLKGFSEKFIKKLWECGKLKSVSDLYKLTPEDFETLEGVGEKTIKSFYAALGSTKEMYLDKFITALGIPTLSTSTSKVLVENFHTWEKIACLRSEELSILSGFAHVSSKEIVDGITENLALAEDLLKVIKIKEKAQGSLTGHSFCVTGSLAKMSRKEFQALVEENGGIFKGSVVQGLTYLVTNKSADSGLSSKHEKALKLGVSVINEAEFLKMVNMDPGEDKQAEEIKIESYNIFE